MDESGEKIVQMAEQQALLRDHFVGWQCRIRQIAMREFGGRPSEGMRPLVSLPGQGEPLGQITVVLVKREPEETTTQMQHIVRRTQDPLQRLEDGMKVLQAGYYQQARGFSDNLAFSRGFAGGLTGRNSMPVTDARFYRNGRFFWDERAATLEAQVLQPIINPVEMGLTLPELVTRVSAQPYYAPLFQRAFGDATVTTDRISRALAQFSRTLVSYRSRYDQGVAASTVANALGPKISRLLP